MEKPFPAYRGDESYAFVCYAHADDRRVADRFLFFVTPNAVASHMLRRLEEEEAQGRAENPLRAD